MKDKIVEQVIEKYKQRSELGIAKYGTTLEENNHDNFFKHLQEELMDATLYLEKLQKVSIATPENCLIDTIGVFEDVTHIHFPTLLRPTDKILLKYMENVMWVTDEGNFLYRKSNLWGGGINGTCNWYMEGFERENCRDWKMCCIEKDATMLRVGRISLSKLIKIAI